MQRLIYLLSYGWILSWRRLWHFDRNIVTNFKYLYEYTVPVMWQISNIDTITWQIFTLVSLNIGNTIVDVFIKYIFHEHYYIYFHHISFYHTRKLLKLHCIINFPYIFSLPYYRMFILNLSIHRFPFKYVMAVRNQNLTSPSRINNVASKIHIRIDFYYYF